MDYKRLVKVVDASAASRNRIAEQNRMFIESNYDAIYKLVWAMCYNGDGSATGASDRRQLMRDLRYELPDIDIDALERANVNMYTTPVDERAEELMRLLLEGEFNDYTYA